MPMKISRERRVRSALTDALAVEDDFRFWYVITLLDGFVGGFDIGVHILFTCLALRDAVARVIVADDITL